MKIKSKIAIAMLEVAAWIGTKVFQLDGEELFRYSQAKQKEKPKENKLRIVEVPERDIITCYGQIDVDRDVADLMFKTYISIELAAKLVENNLIEIEEVKENERFVTYNYKLKTIRK